MESDAAAGERGVLEQSLAPLVQGQQLKGAGAVGVGKAVALRGLQRQLRLVAALGMAALRQRQFGRLQVAQEIVGGVGGRGRRGQVGSPAAMRPSASAPGSFWPTITERRKLSQAPAQHHRRHPVCRRLSLECVRLHLRLHDDDLRAHALLRCS